MRARGLSAASIILLLALDRASKLWALHSLRPIGEIRVLPFMYWTYAENTGAAFSSFRGSNAALTAVSVVVLCGLIYFRRNWIEDAWSRCGFILVVSGAAGNLWDRILYGHVVDFIDFRVWPVFNVADSCITVGAILLALGIYFRKS